MLFFLNHGRETSNRWDILGAGATAQFLRAALNEGRERKTVADNQGAAAQWPTQLVGGNSQQIDAQRPEIDRDLAEGLN